VHFKVTTDTEKIDTRSNHKDVWGGP